MIPSERHPRGGCVGTGPDCSGIPSLNAQRQAERGGEPLMLPTRGKVWDDRPQLPSHFAGSWYCCRHGGNRTSVWTIVHDSLRGKLATAQTQFCNLLACSRRGAVVLVGPDGVVLAAELCTPTRRD